MDSYLNITKALANESRMRTVAALLRYDELCICQLVELLQIAAPTVSRHMSVLQGARLVQNRKDGRWVYYRISGEFPDQLREWFENEVFNAWEIKSDETVLKNILSDTVEELCRNQREKKELNERAN